MHMEGGGGGAPIRHPAASFFTSLALSHPPMQLPLAGVYADGEIGPTIHNATSVLRWSGRRGGGGSSTSKVQGFTTVITALAAAP